MVMTAKGGGAWADPDVTGELPTVLRERLKSLDTQIKPHSAVEDVKALRFQRLHRLYTAAAIFFGTMAVVLVIAQVSEILSGIWPLYTELAAVICVLIIILAGKISGVHEKWLVSRHKAERLNMLFYRCLIDSLPNKQIESEINAIHSVDKIGDIWEWIQQRGIMWNPPADPTAKGVCTIVTYYLRTRLTDQIGYFSQRKVEIERSDKWTRLFPAAFFFFSLGAAILHILIDLTMTEGTDPHLSSGARIGVILVVCAAALPAIGAGMRTFRGANEFARNRVRYRLILDQLKTRDASIRSLRKEHCMTRERDDTSVVPALIEEMHASEEILEYEHQEWLRLMTDTEWFG
ncbi:MAG: hypothetical protein JXA08_03465 [Methanomicrobiaceae archaeon]|nr:hypothetical protein [Methanomicrobiaceae archaeon]